jgi:hypothetical protein
MWDICQPVRAIAEDVVRIRYQEATNEDMGDFMCVVVIVIFRLSKQLNSLFCLYLRVVYISCQ